MQSDDEEIQFYLLKDNVVTYVCVLTFPNPCPDTHYQDRTVRVSTENGPCPFVCSEPPDCDCAALG